MLQIGSPGRTRTYNLVVTSYPIFLPDLDYLFILTRYQDAGR